MSMYHTDVDGERTRPNASARRRRRSCRSAGVMSRLSTLLAKGKSFCSKSQKSRLTCGQAPATESTLLGFQQSPRLDTRSRHNRQSGWFACKFAEVNGSRVHGTKAAYREEVRQDLRDSGVPEIAQVDPTPAALAQRRNGRDAHPQQEGIHSWRKEYGGVASTPAQASIVDRYARISGTMDDDACT